MLPVTNEVAPPNPFRLRLCCAGLLVATLASLAMLVPGGTAAPPAAPSDKEPTVDGQPLFASWPGRGQQKPDAAIILTGRTGEYYFRTIKPVPYTGRTPHIHYQIRKGGKELLTTQCYVKGEAQNARDGVYRGIRDEKARDSVTVEFAPIENSKLGELAANFDIVLGWTPEA